MSSRKPVTYKTPCKDNCQLRSPVTNRCLKPPASKGYRKLKTMIDADPKAASSIIRKKQRLSEEGAAKVTADWLSGPSGIPDGCLDVKSKNALRTIRKDAKLKIPEGYKTILKNKKKPKSSKTFLKMKKVKKPTTDKKRAHPTRAKQQPARKKLRKMIEDIEIEGLGKAPELEIDEDSMPDIFNLDGLPAMASAQPIKHQEYLCGYMAKSGITRMLLYHGTGTGKTVSALYAVHCVLAKLKTKGLVGPGKAIENVLFIVPTANSKVFQSEQDTKVKIEWPVGVTVDYITHTDFSRQMKAVGGKRKLTAAYFSKAIIVIDEAQEYSVPPEVTFKSMPAKVKYIFKATQSAPFVFLLTATPTQNYPSDFAVLHMILANREGDQSVYNRYYKLKLELDKLRALSDSKSFDTFMHEFKKAVNVPDKWHSLLRDVQCQISLLADDKQIKLPLVSHDKHMMPGKFRFYEPDGPIKDAVLRLNDNIMAAKNINAFKINERQLAQQVVITDETGRKTPIYSVKMKAVAKYAMLMASTGRKVVIYCDLVGSGADAVIALLNQYKKDPNLKPTATDIADFERDNGEISRFFIKERSHKDKKKKRVLDDTKVKVKRDLPPLAGYDLSDIEVSIITGEVSGTAKKSGDQSERSRAVNKYNDEIEADGTVKDRRKMKKVIVISSAASRSLELKNTSTIFLLQPPWSYATYQQAIGRVIRNRSHSALPKEYRNVVVYRCASIVKDSKSDKDISVDERIYQLYKMKKMANRYFRHELAQLSIEKSLTKNRTKCYSPKEHGKKTTKVFMKEIRG